MGRRSCLRGASAPTDARARMSTGARRRSQLRDLGGRMISFYGQHEHRKLTLAGAQLEILDRLCGAEHASDCGHARRRTRSVSAGVQRWSALRELADAREHELDLLEHELAEIDAARLHEHEHEQLLARARAPAAPAMRSAPRPAPPPTRCSRSPRMRPAPRMLMAGAARSWMLSPVWTRSWTRSPSACEALAIEAQDVAAELRAYGEQIGRPRTRSRWSQSKSACPARARRAQAWRQRSPGARVRRAGTHQARASWLGAEVASAADRRAAAGRALEAERPDRGTARWSSQGRAATGDRGARAAWRAGDGRRDIRDRAEPPPSRKRAGPTRRSS